MYIKLDKTNMELEVRVGPLENYKPSKEMKKLQAKTEALKAKMQEFMEKEVTPMVKEIEDSIAKENSKFVV